MSQGAPCLQAFSYWVTTSKQQCEMFHLPRYIYVSYYISGQRASLSRACLRAQICGLSSLGVYHLPANHNASDRSCAIGSIGFIGSISAGAGSNEARCPLYVSHGD